MFVIRTEQMKVFSEVAAARYVERCVERLHQQFPRRMASLDDDAAAALVRSGVERAATFGIRAEAAVDDFVDLMVAIAPDFYDQPACAWMRPILEDTDVDAIARMHILADDARKRGQLLPTT